jgi:hypothetical protein
MNFKHPLLILLGAFMVFQIFPGNAIAYPPAPNNPADTDSPTAPEWKVVSAYGPRNPGATGSRFHRGIDYSPAPRSDDFGTIIKARAAGTIADIRYGGGWYISVVTPDGSSQGVRTTYLHIFKGSATSTLPLTVTAIKPAGRYTKVQLITVPKLLLDGTLRYCKAIAFWKNDAAGVEHINKVLTATACAGAQFNDLKGKTVTVKTSVAAEEDIAVLGYSGTGADNAHLHLTVNFGKDNPLVYLGFINGVIDGGKPEGFYVALNHYAYDDTMIKGMTYPGFAVAIVEQTLVPTLDEVTVDFPEDTKPATRFSFGGLNGKEPENVKQVDNPDNILLNLDLEKGAAAPSIKPEIWGESSTPKTTWFFVPYDLSSLQPGRYMLQVGVSRLGTGNESRRTTTSLPVDIYSSRFLKIANDGTVLPFTALPGSGPKDWACTRDTQTGKTWEVKSNDGKLRDERWTYWSYDPVYLPDAYDSEGNYDFTKDPNGRWAGLKNPDSLIGGSNAAMCNSKPAYCNTYAYVNAVNAQGLCGMKDWRMPGINELSSFFASPLYGYLELNYHPIAPAGFNQWMWTKTPSAATDVYFAATDVYAVWASYDYTGWGYVTTPRTSGGIGIGARLVRP